MSALFRARIEEINREIFDELVCQEKIEISNSPNLSEIYVEFYSDFNIEWLIKTLNIINRNSMCQIRNLALEKSDDENSESENSDRDNSSESTDTSSVSDLTPVIEGLSESEHESSNDDQIDNSSDHDEHTSYDIDESHSDQYDSDEYSSCSN